MVAVVDRHLHLPHFLVLLLQRLGERRQFPFEPVHGEAQLRVLGHDEVDLRLLRVDESFIALERGLFAGREQRMEDLQGRRRSSNNEGVPSRTATARAARGS